MLDIAEENQRINVANNLKEIQNEISSAEQNIGRKTGSVKLLAVSKFHPAQSVKDAMAAGQTMFGENRVQEAAAKFDSLRGDGLYPELHIIGALQRNKAKEAVRISSCIESVDRIEIVKEIEKQCAKINKQIKIFFELHTGEESKSGFPDIATLAEAVAYCANGNTPHIIPSGFMTMAPATKDESLIHKSFSTLRNCADKIKKQFPILPLTELSMGMSGDFKIAIEEGSTIVRIGTAIFGARVL